MELRIKEICKEKGITQKQLSEMSGIAEVSLSKSINGNPTVETLNKIASALSVDFVELFERKGDFVALVSHNGGVHRFDCIDRLSDYIDTIKAEER